MVRKCAALFCRSGYSITKRDLESDTQPPISRHVFCFPKDKEIRRKWVEALGRPNIREDNCNYSGVCELHFLPADFIEDIQRQRKRLQREAVPSVFGRNAQERHLRSTSLATPSARRSQDQVALKAQADAFIQADGITGLDELEERLAAERIPSGFRLV